MDHMIYVTRSSMPPYEEYIEAIKPLWESHWLTNMGAFHKELEKQLKEYLDAEGLSLLVNGHMALELALQSFGFPEGSEVITTPFTFISTTHAIVRNRLKPVFCDVNRDDGTIDPSLLENLVSERTVAILPVHVYGNICQVNEIQKVAEKYGLKVIYDAAHAFGEKVRKCDYEDEEWKGIASFGDASIFSFHATKVFNTIEGGAVAFHNQEMYEALYNLKNFGIRGEEMVVSVGANAKMNEFAAAMGLCNLKYINGEIAKRRKVYERYLEALAGLSGIRVLRQKEVNSNYSYTNNYGYLPVVFEDDEKYDRNVVYQKMAANGIHCRKYFYPLTCDQGCFKNKYKDYRLDVARDLSQRVLALPIFADMSMEQVDWVLDVLI